MRKKYSLDSKEKSALVTFLEGNATLEDTRHIIGGVSPNKIYALVTSITAYLTKEKKIDIKKLLADY